MLRPGYAADLVGMEGDPVEDIMNVWRVRLAAATPRWGPRVPERSARARDEPRRRAGVGDRFANGPHGAPDRRG